MDLIEPETRAARKRAEILEAARRRFITEGFAGAGMEQIARDASVSTATLYDHFPSKAELFRCVAEAAAQSLPPAAVPGSAVGDRGQRLTAFAVAYARFLSDPTVQMLTRTFVAEPKRFEPAARAFAGRGREAFRAALLGLLQKLDGEGRIFTPNPQAAAGQLMGMIEHAVLMGPLLTAQPPTPPRLAEQACTEAVATFLARYGVRTEAEAA